MAATWSASSGRARRTTMRTPPVEAPARSRPWAGPCATSASARRVGNIWLSNLLCQLSGFDRDSPLSPPFRNLDFLNPAESSIGSHVSELSARLPWNVSGRGNTGTPPAFLCLSFLSSFDNHDFLLGQSVEFVHELVNLLVGRRNLALKATRHPLRHSSFRVHRSSLRGAVLSWAVRALGRSLCNFSIGSAARPVRRLTRMSASWLSGSDGAAAVAVLSDQPAYSRHERARNGNHRLPATLVGCLVLGDRFGFSLPLVALDYALHALLVPTGWKSLFSHVLLRRRRLRYASRGLPTNS